MQTSLAYRTALFGVLFIWSISSSQSRAQTTPTVDRPIQYLSDKMIQGTDSVVVPGATLLIGEVHGTWETPILVATLVRQAVVEDTETILCIEVSSSEQASLDRFLSSDGGTEAKRTLLKQPHWTNQDGRASIGMFAMLELLRRLRSEGKKLQVIAMDSNWNVPEADISSLSPERLRQLEVLASERDHEMAKAVVQAREGAAEALIIACAGNVHTRVIKGAAWDPNYIPMGWYISQKLKDVVSLDTDYASGEAWATTERGSGPTNFGGKDQGPIPFVKMFEDAESGYNGTLYVGRITAAEPAAGKNGG